MRRVVVMRSAALAAFGLGLLIAGVLGAGLIGLGCDENVRGAESTRNDVCSAIGEFGGPRWWLLACAPTVLFLSSALTRWGRDRRARLAVAMFAALCAVDGVLVAIVTSNLLA